MWKWRGLVWCQTDYRRCSDEKKEAADVWICSFSLFSHSYAHSKNSSVPSWVSSTLIGPCTLKLTESTFLNCCPRLPSRFCNLLPSPRTHEHTQMRWVNAWTCTLQNNGGNQAFPAAKHRRVNKVCFGTDSGAETWGWVRRFALQVCFKGTCST